MTANIQGRVHVGSLALDSLTMSQAVRRICRMAGGKHEHPKMVATANAQFAQIAGADQHFRRLLKGADLVVADGMSVVLASRLLGHPLPERIAGVDLLVELCEEAANAGLTVYFLGGRPGAAEKAAENLCGRFPRLTVAGIDCPPLGFEKDPVEAMGVVRRIRRAAPDILFVGLGAPKQEYWMEEHADALPVKVMIGVGCSFDVLSGEMPRAPRWMQQTGLEWAFRLGQEPGRLWKRYLLGNAQFTQMVFRQWRTQRRDA
jgi:N-acetylglucosaminyldiphosphoundecaprenol N-acetyl-beta-D-mannosaminyltransferase